jgi:hypothetical protein
MTLNDGAVAAQNCYARGDKARHVKKTTTHHEKSETMRKRVTVRLALLRRRSQKFCGIVFAMTNKSKFLN